MIPSNLEECFDALLLQLCCGDLEAIENYSEEEVVILHHTLGRWIRNTWGLWSGSPLKDYFIKLGLSHPDDMSGVILTSFHRHLHKIPLNVEAQVQRYLDYWENQK